MVYPILFAFLFLFFSLRAQDRPFLQPGELIKLIPAQIPGFQPEGKPAGRMIRIGNISYSMVEHHFKNRNQKIRILLFDYNNALIMFNQALRQWNTNGQNQRPTPQDEGGLYRELVHPTQNTAQIFMGVNGRFFLNISAEYTDIELLRSVLNDINFEGMYRTPLDEAKYR